MKDGEKIPREDSLMLRSSSLLNETTGLWPDTTELWLEKHKNTQNTKTKRERSSEAAIVGAMLVSNERKMIHNTHPKEFKGGYEGLITNLMSELPDGLVSYNRPVQCVHWSNTKEEQNSVTVECEDGERIVADHVIVTVPLGYLKRHHSSLFQPPLPLHKLHSIQRLGFGTNNKIFVEFDAPWWDADCDVIQLVWEDEDALVDQVPDVQRSWTKKLFGFTVVQPTERYGHLVCGWIAGHESEHMETLSEQEVMHAVTQLIRRFTGNPSITPRRILRSQWFHDPWTNGSYSHLAMGCSEQDLKNMMEPLPLNESKARSLQVLFAGEATHLCYFSTVHGALLTGWREADRLISHYSSSNPSARPTSKL
ncbi:hypothetical protein CHARACLAT_002172 [Characodon lateralis]|uniref:Amine oxidase domain-containing protein n=1 Tax=Characodon lateralis TaxID=208331 RepID=A0ABU7DZ13_9TELE|nr:hypothetical protein [Characodon lateralis]